MLRNIWKDSEDDMNGCMLTYEKAKEIGREACIDRLGRDFVMRYRDTSSSAYSDREDHAYCFV